jgi:hypothetical protein
MRFKGPTHLQGGSPVLRLTKVLERPSSNTQFREQVLVRPNSEQSTTSMPISSTFPHPPEESTPIAEPEPRISVLEKSTTTAPEENEIVESEHPNSSSLNGVNFSSCLSRKELFTLTSSLFILQIMPRFFNTFRFNF